MKQVIYLTPDDYRKLCAFERLHWPTAHPLEFEGMPIISADGLRKMGVEVPDVSTVYEIRARDDDG